MAVKINKLGWRQVTASRMEATAEILIDLVPPAIGRAEISISLLFNDNPTLDELRDRILAAVAAALTPAP